MIAFSATLLKREKINEDQRKIIVKAWEKGIYQKIKGASMPPSSHLFKVYATTIDGARRIVYLYDITSDTAFFFVLSNKK